MRDDRNTEASEDLIVVLAQSGAWSDALADAEGVVRAAVEAALMEGGPRARDTNVTIVLADDAGVRALNARFRNQDKPTNVLSFPARAPTTALVEKTLGDVVLAYETVAREAAEQAKPFVHHVSHLVVHGVLHLLGYDHDADAEAQTMEALEVSALARLDIPNPYAGSTEPAASRVMA